MMAADSTTREAARQRAYAAPLDGLDPSNPDFFRDDVAGFYFERLRREEPVHWCPDSAFGPYWSITRFEDILRVETNHQVFSSAYELGGVTIYERPASFNAFITMDPPHHAEKRKTVAPAVAPANLRRLEAIIRERACTLLDALPVGETFNWVDHVSSEITIQMLATLLDFPFEERHRLRRWSDVATCMPTPGGVVETEADREAELNDCLEYFRDIWAQRLRHPDGDDLLSMLARSPATREMDAEELRGTLLLLIIGANDTTRNSISGAALGLETFPDELAKLRARPELFATFPSEIVRWQTPIAHMRRTAVADFELGGRSIRSGDKVVMWYISANRDEAAIDRPEELILDRENPRHHASFGFGVHRCVGNRLAELQLRIVWEEILKRFRRVELDGEPLRTRSNMIHGFESLPVRVRPA